MKERTNKYVDYAKQFVAEHEHWLSEVYLNTATQCWSLPMETSRKLPLNRLIGNDNERIKLLKEKARHWLIYSDRDVSNTIVSNVAPIINTLYRQALEDNK
jgi:hypothetical protein